MGFFYSDMEQHLDHSKQTLAWRLRHCQQNGRPLGIYAEGLYDAVQGLGLTEASLNYHYLAGLDKPVNWDGLGDLRAWYFWDLVDHVIAHKELELEMEVLASLSARLAVPEDPWIWSAAPRTSRSFLGYLLLRRCVDDPPLTSVRRAVPLPAHKAPEAVVPTHNAPEAAVPTHNAPEAAVPAHVPPEVEMAAQDSTEVAVLAQDVPAHNAPDAEMAAQDSPEATVLAHDSPEAAVPAHVPPEAAVPAHVPPEAAVPAHVPPEAAVPAHVPPEAAVPAHVPPEATCPLTFLPRRRCPLTMLLRWRWPLRIPLRRRCSLTIPLRRRCPLMFLLRRRSPPLLAPRWQLHTHICGGRWFCPTVFLHLPDLPFHPFKLPVFAVRCWYVSHYFQDVCLELCPACSLDFPCLFIEFLVFPFGVV